MPTLFYNELFYMKKSAFLSTSSALQTVKATLLLLLFSAVIFTACNDDKKQIDALATETEAIHDAAMKDMADMNRIARELKATMIAATMTPEQSAVYNEVLTKIGNAENGMMEWMKDYKPTDQLAPAEALKYLQGQKALIEKNHTEIKAALEAGKNLQGK